MHGYQVRLLINGIVSREAKVLRKITFLSELSRGHSSVHGDGRCTSMQHVCSITGIEEWHRTATASSRVHRNAVTTMLLGLHARARCDTPTLAPYSTRDCDLRGGESVLSFSFGAQRCERYHGRDRELISVPRMRWSADDSARDADSVPFGASCVTTDSPLAVKSPWT